jgi:hypothetical protein
MTGAAAPSSVALIIAPDDQVAATPPVAWAINQLDSALGRHGVSLHRFSRLEDAGGHRICVLAAGPGSGPDTKLAVPVPRESLA